MPTSSDPKKIIEVSGNEWMKGISIQDTHAIGGIFQSSAYNFNPFETMGYLQTALSPVAVDGTKVLQASNSCVYAYDSDGYIVFLGNRSGGGAKNLYRIKASDQSVTDYSVTGGSGAGARNFGGLGFYKGRIVFSDLTGGSIWSLVISGIGTELSLLSPTGFSASDPTVFHNAPDGNLYFCRYVANGEVGRIDSVTGAGTSTGSAFTGDTALTPKDLTSDGRYEIIIMDDNPTKVTGITASCKVYFWDMDKADADVVQTIPDSYLIASRWVDGRLLVIGASGIWQCGIGTSPRLVFPLSSSELPLNPYAVTVRNNILYWGTNSVGSRIYGYGADVGKPILFAPHQTFSGNAHTTLVASGTSFYAGITTGNNPTSYIFVHNTGTTRSNASVATVPSQLAQPWSFSYARVVLKSVLTSGQAVALTINNGDGTVIMDTTTKSFSTDPNKKTFLFHPKPSSGSVQQFDDIYFTINPQGGAVVQKVIIYGKPKGEFDQSI